MDKEFKCNGQTDRTGLYLLIFLIIWILINIQAEIRQIKKQVIPADTLKVIEQADTLSVWQKLDNWYFENLSGK